MRLGEGQLGFTVTSVTPSIDPAAIRNIGLDCRSVTSRGHLVTCPAGEYRTRGPGSQFCSQYPITPSPRSSLYFSRTTESQPLLL